MNTLPKMLLALCLAALVAPVLAQLPPAQLQPRAYAPEDLRQLSYPDQVRVISLEYEEQSGGRRIPDDQLRFYLDQVNRSDWTFSRVREDIARSLERGLPPAGGNDTLRCESSDNRSRHCPTPWPGPSRLVRQLSRTPCQEGRNWSTHFGQVSVWDGCRAEFAEDQAGPGPGHDDALGIRCESIGHRTRTCPTPWPGRSRLVRQLSGSSCREGFSWNSQDGQVTVWAGCRAEFAEDWRPGPGYGYPPSDVRCESNDNRTRTCPTPWRGRSQLLRQISRSPCIEGRSWNSQDGRITVWDGCRADFGPARAPWHSDPGGGYSVTCASEHGRYTTCRWPPGQGRPRLLQQLSSAPCVRDRSWGLVDPSTLWVDHGCRARFGR